MAAVSTLTDDFATTDSGKWTYQAGTTVSGGRLVCDCNTSYTGELRSISTYDLTGSAAYVELVQPATLSGETYVSLWNTGANTNAVGFLVLGGNLIAVSRVGGGYSEVLSVAYNSTNHRWLKISETGGTVTWWTSTNGTSWTSFTTLANPITITALNVLLGSGGDDAAGDALFDNLNRVDATGSQLWIPIRIMSRP